MAYIIPETSGQNEENGKITCSIHTTRAGLQNTSHSLARVLRVKTVEGTTDEDRKTIALTTKKVC